MDYNNTSKYKVDTSVEWLTFIAAKNKKCIFLLPSFLPYLLIYLLTY